MAELRTSQAIAKPEACAHTGCTAEGIWHPTLMLAHKSKPEVAVPACLSIKLCDEHRASALLEDFMSDEGWEQICSGFAARGFARPTRALTRLDWSRQPPAGFVFPKRS